MTKTIYEVLIQNYRDKVAISACDLTVYDDGEERKSPPRDVKATDADVVAFIGQFNSAAVAERDAKIAELAQAQTDHAAAMAAKESEHAAALSTLNTEHAEALQAKADEIAALNTAHAEALAAKAEEIAGLQSDLSTANTDKAAAVSAKDAAEAALAAAQARIAELEAELDALKNPPVTPTILEPGEFIDRFTEEELGSIQVASDNPVARKAMRVLFTRLEVNLESPLLTQLMSALVQAGFIAEERVSAILAPEGE